MNLNKKKVGVLLGGDSLEREVSLSSGENVYQALDKRGYKAVNIDYQSPMELISRLTEERDRFDVIFNCLHGGIGEDGTIQALLEFLYIPYTGSPVLANVVAMDKLESKKRFKIEGIPTPPCISLPEGEIKWRKLKDKATREIGFPLVIKPVSEGSSVGVNILENPTKFEKICQKMKAEYQDFFIEKYIPGTEVTAGILKIGGQHIALPLIELRTKTEFYNYKAKYTPGMTEFIIPAKLSPKTTRRVKELATAAHHALGCFGFSRVDFRVSPDQEIFALEVNTVPGMTQTSDLPKAAQHAGMEFDLLVEYMLKTVCKNHGAD